MPLQFPATDPPVDGRDAGANVPGNVLSALAVEPQPDNPHAVDPSRGCLGGRHDVPVWWGRATGDQGPSSMGARFLAIFWFLRSCVHESGILGLCPVSLVEDCTFWFSFYT